MIILVCLMLLAMGRLRALSMIPLSLMSFLLFLVIASAGLVLCQLSASGTLIMIL